METNILPHISSLPRVFKSYYVVWKPTYTLPGNNEGDEFKSYYVVWKRFNEAYFIPVPINV